MRPVSLTPAINQPNVRPRFSGQDDKPDPDEVLDKLHRTGKISFQDGELPESMADFLLDWQHLVKTLGFEAPITQISMAKSLEDLPRVKAELTRVPAFLPVTLSIPLTPSPGDTSLMEDAQAAIKPLADTLELDADRLELKNVMSVKAQSLGGLRLKKDDDGKWARDHQPTQTGRLQLTLETVGSDNKPEVFKLHQPDDWYAFQAKGPAIMLEYLQKHPRTDGTLTHFMTVEITPRNPQPKLDTEA